MSFLKELSENKQAITLYKYNGNDITVDPEISIKDVDKSSDYINICFIDLETTGTHKKNDLIIEIALKVMHLNKHTAEESKAIYEYQSFQDPGIKIQSKNF